MMKLVLQETHNGCGIACVAMVTGRSFREAMALFEDGHRDVHRSGADLSRALASVGVASASRMRREVDLAAIPDGSIFEVKIRSKGPDAAGHYLVKVTEELLLDPADGALRRLPPGYVVQAYLLVRPSVEVSSVDGDPDDNEAIPVRGAAWRRRERQRRHRST